MLYGVKFQIVTDHSPLKAVFSSTNLSPRLARWMGRLEMFDPEITYREGKKHGNADGLSRMAVEEEEEGEEILPEIINKVIYEEEIDNFEEKLAAGEVLKENNDCNWNINNIKSINIQASVAENEQSKDENIIWIYNIIKQELYNKEMEYTAFSNINHSKFENKEKECLFKQKKRLRIINKTFYREYVDENENVIIQYVVPKHLREVMITKAHDGVYGAHQGRDKVIERLRRRCYWPKMNQEIAEYIKTCEICQSIKPPNQYNNPELQPILTSHPLELITTDLMGPCQETENKNKYILIIIDHFTKWMDLAKNSRNTTRINNHKR